jgi:uncharacterized membrane protein YphA (DoxX/SURF4 family)
VRTNPFYDAWLFLIGATDYPDEIGAFKYVLVAFFWLLLIGSCVIAAINWQRDPRQRDATHVATWICRVLIGSMWFQGCLWKLPLPVSGGFEFWTQELGKYAAFELHRELVTHVFLPNLAIINPLVFLAEISFAISLILGIGVRFFASITVLFALHLWLGLYHHPSEWPWEYIFIVVIHVLFVAYAAGRSLGLDALLRTQRFQGIAANIVAVAT